MAFFDAISDFLKPIGDVVGEVLDSPLGKIGKAYVEGSGMVSRNARERAEQARRLQRENLMPVGTRVEAGDVPWGLKNYAQDPASMERYWQSVLAQFLTPNATGVKK